ncbi:hypothetical protein [Streptomyces sp. A5-4]|uniref:hypothetical protein n=1 Tax=Streptomyces sp. A5-4 TaxID=3384771 RepID=UPI003DA87E38
MTDYHSLEFGDFVDDSGTIHKMAPSSVIASVPAAKTAAEKYGREARFDFLDDRAVHWMLHQRREDTAKGGMLGCLFSLPLAASTLGGWMFWELVAAQKSRQFQIGFIVADALIICALIITVYLLRRPTLLNETVRNVRCRARLYRKIVGIARRGGADIPSLYPYYGMYASSQKFFPDAPELPIPENGGPA